jgi:tRNA-dihydrouridine synthase B
MTERRLKKIKIGEHIKLPVILAPMCGVTDSPFRKLVKTFGAGLTISEMIPSNAMTMKTKHSLRKSAFSSVESVPVVQIAGCDPKIVANAARLCEELGAKIIDLNFGCPVKKVVGGNAGSALMKDRELAGAIMESAVKAVNIPITVKMRTGWDENHRNATDIAKMAEDLGVQMITIHGRTRSQMFQGKADWDFIRSVKEKISIPVIANGDIKSPEDAERCLAVSNADGIMIGRGIYGKPWLLNQIIQRLADNEQIPDPSLQDICAILLAHYKDMIKYYGEEVAVPFARKHVGWYTSGLSNSSKFRMEFNHITSSTEATDKISDYFNTLTC